MDDTLEKRMNDVERMLVHLPNDLDVRFAGMQAGMGRRFDQLLLRSQTHDARFDQLAQTHSVLEARLANIERALEALVQKGE